MKKNKCILIGIPGCGKSTLGRRVADVLKIPFFDVGSMIVEKLKPKGVGDFFRATFNEQFLVEQAKAIAKLAKVKKFAIIATCAETALTPVCTELMRNMGTIIHIQRKPELVLADLKNSDKPRLVLVNEKSGKEIVMEEEAVTLYAQECTQYEALANLTLENNGSEDEGVEKLVALINLSLKEEQ